VWTTTDPIYSTPSPGLTWERYDQGYFNDQFNWFANYSPSSTGTWNTVNYTWNGGTQNYYSYRISGFYKATYNGNHRFWMNSDDSSWLWIGLAGETVSSLESRRSASNETIDNSGTHSANAVYSQWINMVAGQYYPLLVYYGENYDYYWWQNNEILQIQVDPPQSGWTYNADWYQDDSVLIGGGQPHPQEREGEFDTSIVNGVTTSGVQSSYI
jgi:hypothetical protein